MLKDLRTVSGSFSLFFILLMLVVPLNLKDPQEMLFLVVLFMFTAFCVGVYFTAWIVSASLAISRYAKRTIRSTLQ